LKDACNQTMKKENTSVYCCKKVSGNLNLILSSFC